MARVVLTGQWEGAGHTNPEPERKSVGKGPGAKERASGYTLDDTSTQLGAHWYKVRLGQVH